MNSGETSGYPLREIEEALRTAFPEKVKLERMLFYQFGVNLEDIALGNNYTEIAFKVVKYFENKNRLLELINGALHENSGNIKLQEVINKINVNNPHLSDKPLLERFEFDVVMVNEPDGKISREKHQAQYFIEDLGNGITLEMVAIPGGKFIMGAPKKEQGSGDDERPQHQVTVPPLFMAKYPVTQAQWRAVAALPQVNKPLDPNPSHFRGDDRPVELISWYDAVEFCVRLNDYTARREYRLPSEAEWEYACCAGTNTPFHFGETITTDLVNYDGNYIYANSLQGEYRRQTTPVGSFPPNAFGLYDMHGNVWEWCVDTWHYNYKGAPTDGSAWIENEHYNDRLLRGGSWNSFPGNCRSACRNDKPPVVVDCYFGFRVVCGSVARTL